MKFNKETQSHQIRFIKSFIEFIHRYSKQKERCTIYINPTNAVTRAKKLVINECEQESACTTNVAIYIYLKLLANRSTSITSKNTKI